MIARLEEAPGGLLRTDAAQAKTEENLDGKYLLGTADPKLSAEDIAACGGTPETANPRIPLADQL